VTLASEAVVRDEFRRHVLATTPGVSGTVDEFWVPRSHERADLVLLGQRLDGFEIKTDRDTLRRLPRQVSAYGRIFDRCTAVVACRHLERVIQIVPDWWGITTVARNGRTVFSQVRPAGPNPGVEAETLVRLLWRDEAMATLLELGLTPPETASRASLWRELLLALPLHCLQAAVRAALARRDPGRARIPTRRFRTPSGAHEADR
jgi:hypothetical protein